METITITTSNTITISLNQFESQFLVMLSQNGGRVKMNHRDLTEGPIKALETLHGKGAIVGRPTLFLFEYEYELTSTGSNLVDMILKNKD